MNKRCTSNLVQLQLNNCLRINDWKIMNYIKMCSVCNKKFKTYRKETKYCSRVCWRNRCTYWEIQNTPIMIERNKKRIISKLLQYEYKDKDNCWNWQGSKTYKNYGIMKYCGKNMTAHRASWLVFNGKIHNGLWVLHKCGNRQCVNPNHLFLGTVQDNVAYMINKGRNDFSKINFTKDEIREIITLARNGLSRNKIAKKFNLTDDPIHRILKENNINERRLYKGTINFSKEEKNNIVTLYKDGKSLCKIAKIFGFTRDPIKRILKEKRLM